MIICGFYLVEAGRVVAIGLLEPDIDSIADWISDWIDGMEFPADWITGLRVVLPPFFSSVLASVLALALSTNDSGPTWTLNVAPRKRTTRMKTKRVIERGLRILKRDGLIFGCKFIQ